jgi:sulfonate transport system ATP-binding protein
MTTGSLAIQGVSKRFAVNGRAFVALDNVDLTVAPGEFVTILGTSGCGKSTLLRLIAGLETSSEGSILHDDLPVAGPSLERGLVFQESRLFPWLSVTQNIDVALANANLPAAQRRDLVESMITLVGLRGFETAWPHQLSGGMAQRVAIARGLVNKPDVLLLDEPFGALDALTRARLQDELLGIWARERTTMLLVTHDVDEALTLGDRVVVMSPRPGRIKRIFANHMPRPRDRNSAAFGTLRGEILSILEGDHSTPPPATEPHARPVLAGRWRTLFAPLQGADQGATP